MSDTQRDNLSAGMDGELSNDELRFLLRRLDHDDSLQQAWSRYHVARDGLRRQLPPLASQGFALRVMQVIEAEGVVVHGKRRHWLHWSAGGAIAASVAVAALMIAQPAGSGADSGTPHLASARASQAGLDSGAQVARSEVPAVAPRWVNAYADSPYKLSQQASATLEGDSSTLLYSRDSLSPYRVGRRPISNGDGSYLLLIHPDQAQPSVEQAPDSAQ